MLHFIKPKTPQISFKPQKSFFSSLGFPNLPKPKGEKPLNYSPNSSERKALEIALKETKNSCPKIPCVVNGKEIWSDNVKYQVMPSLHKEKICVFHEATPETIKLAIKSNLNAKKQWEYTSFEDRAAIFYRAANLIAKYRAKICAAVMLGTGKNVWQAEIDAACEAIDFLRFSPYFAQSVYQLQPFLHTNGTWNRQEHRPLEGFITAISPFNFCAIGINLVSTPAIMGNCVIWKPSSTSILGNYLMFKILQEAGLPDGVINFIPSSGKDISSIALRHKDLSGVHFTGSTEVFEEIWKKTAQNLGHYNSYPRIVGETGGKNFHFVHQSAHIDHVVHQSIRSAFEYQGQKCSALSRLFVPKTLWPLLKKKLISEVEQIKMGQPDEFDSFMTAVIDKKSFMNAKSYIEYAKASNDHEIIVGGHCDDSIGYFIAPTVVLTHNIKSKLLSEEIFAPILTVYVYEDDLFEKTLSICSKSSRYALTGSVFATDRYAIRKAMDILRHSAGNFYINDKCTGAVVGEQPFGGARKSGTNDKAGSVANYYRWVSSQTIKESFDEIETWKYPHMDIK